MRLVSALTLRAAKGMPSRVGTGTVKFGFAPSVAAHRYTPQALRTCQHEYPGIELLLHETPTVMEELLSGGLHCGLMRLLGSLPDSLAFETLLHESVFVALPSGHPVLKKGKLTAGGALSLRQLRGEGFVVSRQPGAPGFYRCLIDLCRKCGFEPRILVEVDRAITSLTLVAAGAGISVVPASLRTVHSHAITYRPLADSLDSPIVLAYRRADCHGVVATSIDLLRRVAKHHRA